MANWRRGFFRLWALVALLWIVILGIYIVPSYLNPYVGDLSSTMTKGEFETLKWGSSRFGEVFGSTNEGYYQKASFGDLLLSVRHVSARLSGG